MFRNLVRGDLVALLLRLGLGLICVAHGLNVVRNGWGADWQAVLPAAAQVAAGWAEVVAGALLILGLFTRPAALVLAALAGVGGYIALRHRPLFSTEPPATPAPGNDILTVAGEYSLALLLIGLAVVILGGGLFSLDRLVGKLIRRKSREVVSSVVSPSASHPPRA